MRFSGKIIRSDGAEITGVNGEYHLHDPPIGLKSWHGHFVLPTGKHVDVGECRLVLDDGREGEILVSNLSTGSHQASIAYFKGSGPWP